MKKILLTVVLGIAVVAGAQDAAQPAQGQPAGAGSAGASGGAGDQRSCRIQRLCGRRPADGSECEDQRAGSVPHAVSQQRHEEPGAGNLMGTYQQAGNTKKTMETAAKLVTADPAMCGRWRCWPTSTASWRRVAIRTPSNCWRMARSMGSRDWIACRSSTSQTAPRRRISKMKDQMTGNFNAIGHRRCGGADAELSRAREGQG